MDADGRRTTDHGYTISSPMSRAKTTKKKKNSAVLGPIWPNFELVRDVMNVLVTCEYEEDPIKN